MDDVELRCGLDLAPTPDGDIGLAFEVHNPGSQPVKIQFFRPFFGFDLTVHADDGPIPVIQPAYTVQVQPDTMTIVPGATVRIETPVQLRFDPRVPPSGGDVSTRWSLPHVPVPVRVQAALQLTGVTVGSCEARFDPQGAHEHRLRAGSGGVVRQSS